MKKLILIFSLLLSSINVSANLSNKERIADFELSSDDFLISSSASQERQDQAQDSFDTYEAFLKFNAQQAIDNPKGTRVSENLLNKAKVVAMYDLVAYAVSSTFQGILTRNPDAGYNYEVTPSDIEEGINASREIISSFRDNPVFSALDQLNMASSANYYFNTGWNSDKLTAGSHALSERAFQGLLARDKTIYNIVFWAERDLEGAKRFSRNFLSTFFTNQNAIQSTCPGAGSCAYPVGGMK